MAFLLVAVLTALISIGIKESMRVNLVLVGVKLFIVLFVIVAGIGFINGRQLHARSSRRRSRPPGRARASTSR